MAEATELNPTAVEAEEILAALAAEDEAIEAAEADTTAFAGVEPETDFEEADEGPPAGALQAEVQALRAMNATLQNAHAALARRYDEQRQIDEHLAAQAIAEREQARMPKREEDPVGYLDAKLDAIGETFRARTEEQEARQRFEAEQRQAEAINAAITSSCEEAAAEWPEFPQCVQHIASTVVNVLTRSGRSEQEARQVAAAQLNEIALAALRNGEDPADALWQAAWYMGYRYEEPPAEMPLPSAQDPYLAARQHRAETANARREPRTTTPPAPPLRGTEILDLSPDDLLQRFRDDPVKAEAEYFKAMELAMAAE